MNKSRCPDTVPQRFLTIKYLRELGSARWRDVLYDDQDVRCIQTNEHQSWWTALVRAFATRLFFSDVLALYRKTPWKLSVTRKANARARLKKVDAVIEAVRASGVQCGSLVRVVLCSSIRTSMLTFRVWRLKERALELPKEHEMPAKDKYTIFSATAKGYRKGIHKVPKWTRVRRNMLETVWPRSWRPQMTLRTNPKGF